MTGLPELPATTAPSVPALFEGQTGLEKIPENLPSNPGDLPKPAADVTKPEDARRIVEEAVSRSGALDVLVACAGIFHATPFDRIQPTIAFPSGSMTSCGRDAFRPGPESTSGGDHFPPKGCVATAMTRKPPSDPSQAATAPPSLSSATTGAPGLPTGSDTASEGVHAPSIVLAADTSTR